MKKEKRTKLFALPKKNSLPRVLSADEQEAKELFDFIKSLVFPARRKLGENK